MFRWLKRIKKKKVSLSKKELETLIRELEESTNHSMPSTTSEIVNGSPGGLRPTGDYERGLGGQAVENHLIKKSRDYYWKP